MAWLRLCSVVVLACVLLTPKVSLALSLLLGDGYRTVIVCTPQGLTRITLTSSGEVVSDVSEAWIAPNCVLTTADVTCLERAWQRAAYPEFSADINPVHAAPAVSSPLNLRPSCTSRGPLLLV